MIQRLYISIEEKLKDRPVFFWIITLIITTIPLVSFYNSIIEFLNSNYIMKGYQVLSLILSPFLIYWIFQIANPNKLKKEILKELTLMKMQLDNPFEHETTNLKGTQKLNNKYYHYEILELFDRYNSELKRLKDKWPNEFRNFQYRNDKPVIHKTDWVSVNYVQVLKSDVIALIEKLK